MPAEAALVRWEGSTALIEFPNSPAGTLSGYFDFDTTTGAFGDIAVSFDSAGSVGPEAPKSDFTLDTLVGQTPTLGIFVDGASGPGYVGTYALRVTSNDAGFGEIGGVLKFIGLVQCSSFGCGSTLGLGISGDGTGFTSRSLTPVPLPAGGALLLSGFLALGIVRLRRTPAVA
jgi:hypothetical protein